MTHQQLQTIDADTLLSTTLPPTRFIIDRLLPQGLHILAGAPKVGKSWLALWLCLQVAQGTSVWDFPTHRGTVLYLCLEDSLTRIQSRLFQITDDAPEALSLSAFLRGLGGFEGTATELSALLEAQTGEKLTPSVLSKRLVKYAEVLEQNGIRVVSERTRMARTLSILCLPCDGSDGSDGKN